jgi:predicted RNase H-like nuclease (RuvC/YqgF family)
MIETDPRLKKMISLVQTRDFLPLKQYVGEALEILRNSPAPRPDSKAIIKARMQLANDRSRLVEKRLIIAREMAQFRQLQSDLTDYLLAKYNSGYLGSIKNARSREAVINKAIQPLSKRVAGLESALEAVNMVVADLDAKAFTIRDIMEAIKLGERE